MVEETGGGGFVRRTVPWSRLLRFGVFPFVHVRPSWACFAISVLHCFALFFLTKAGRGLSAGQFPGRAYRHKSVRCIISKTRT